LPDSSELLLRQQVHSCLCCDNYECDYGNTLVEYALHSVVHNVDQVEMTCDYDDYPNQVSYATDRADEAPHIGLDTYLELFTKTYGARWLLNAGCGLSSPINLYGLPAG
jgi:hypothetical protein